MVLGIPTTLIDIRPLDSTLPGVSFVQEDATNLNGMEDNSVESLSALCSLEHFGLGRYGDPINPEACFEAFKSIQRVVAPGGKIYISLLVSKEDCCQFNAHRVFAPRTIVRAFDLCDLKEFSIVDKRDSSMLTEFCDISIYNHRDGQGMGLFLFEKR